MAKYIFSKALTKLLANEAAIEEARQNTERPPEKKPISDLFPEFILQSKLLKKIPGRPMLVYEVSVTTLKFLCICLSYSFLLLLFFKFPFSSSFIRHCK